MRQDLTKQLCERERSSSHRGYYECRNTKFNDQYKEREPLGADDMIAVSASSVYRESMKKRYGWDTKEFGEHLAPLYGLIRKYVGRRWDTFYSDLAKAFDRRSVTGQHIYQHLYDRLADPEKTFIDEDGEVSVYWYGMEPCKLRDSYSEYYVDPRDGIIKRNKHYQTARQRSASYSAAARREKALVMRAINDSEEYHKVDGIWYHFTFKSQEPRREVKWYHFERCNQSFMRERIYYEPRRCLLKGRPVEEKRFAVTKRQASKKEIRQHSLPQ